MLLRQRRRLRSLRLKKLPQHLLRKSPKRPKHNND
jgi:hypothetical protein